MARSGRSTMSALMSVSGAKRTTGRLNRCLSLAANAEAVIRLGSKSAVQRSPGGIGANLRLDDCCPKDLPHPPAGCAANRTGRSGLIDGARGGVPMSHEAARVHHAARRRGGSMAARGARAAAGDAGGRLSRIPDRPDDPERAARISQGPEETGYVEGQNVTIEYRWAENRSNGCRRWRPNWFAGRSR